MSGVLAPRLGHVLTPCMAPDHVPVELLTRGTPVQYSLACHAKCFGAIHPKGKGLSVSS